MMGWWAAMVPQGTPKAATDQINKWFDQVRVGGDRRFWRASAAIS
jgi:hypothetical protein